MARILVIDDEDLILATLNNVLSLAGHEVLTARDGAQGLAMFERQPVDLVVTDIIMPEKEGVETIIELRRRRPNLPIIAISGGGRIKMKSEEILVAAAKLGANEILAKPFEPAALCAAVARLLNRA
jgi:DNA-binding response OmpR family regulator